MDSVDDYWKKNYRVVTVKLKDGTKISGKLNTGEYPRVSDFFRSSPHQFFVMTDAEHSGSLDVPMHLRNAPTALMKGLGHGNGYRYAHDEADAFAAETTQTPGNMISALKKLSVDNLSNLTPHPLKVFLEYSHPPVLERIKALRAFEKEEQ